MKILGQFEIHDLFKITGRGLVLAGKLLSDTVDDISLKPGDEVHVRVSGEERTYRIKSIVVGFSRVHSNQYFPSQNLGLLLDIPEEDHDELVAWRPENTIAALISGRE